MSNLLYFCGMCSVVKELLLIRYFSKVKLHYFFIINHHKLIGLTGLENHAQGVRGSAEVPESDVVQSCRRVSHPNSALVHFIFSMLVYYRNL